MHQQDSSTEVLTQAILRYAVERIRMNPPTLDGPKPDQDSYWLEAEGYGPSADELHVQF